MVAVVPHSAHTAAVLARLDRVRPYGDGWTARCPAHEDRTASLSVAEGDDGRALLHCFAGCHINNVVGALGLHLRDLFPRPLASLTAAELADQRAHGRMTSWRAALAVLHAEVAVVEIAAAELAAGRALADQDHARLELAAARISRCRAALVPETFRPIQERAA
jgi:hypothetical protein